MGPILKRIGLGVGLAKMAALAMLIFISVMPVMVLNIRRMQRED